MCQHEKPWRSRTSKRCSASGSISPKSSGNRPAKGSFSPSRIFWLFLSQVLTKDESCRETLRGFLAWLARERGKTASPNTAAYCKARARLSLQDIQKTHRRVVRKIEKQKDAYGLWYGRRVKVVDGSSVSMPDTPENQETYPQPSRQKKGCGFPIMRITALFSLATGTILALAKDRLHVSERELFRNSGNTSNPRMSSWGTAGSVDSQSSIYYCNAEWTAS